MSAPEISRIQEPQFRLAKKRRAHLWVWSSRFWRFDESPCHESLLRCPRVVDVEAPPHARSQIGDQGKVTIGDAGEPLRDPLEPAAGGKHPVSDGRLGIEVKTPMGKP